ncbi:carbohydrate sulfotransferase 11 [Eurytemora carolleeae]|uniref:carbohydrate sulfotransferase 11 n=1 Tax=Eurytemora carolleeae TaxID=1294199 RepID=UPI000C769F05|nr:carbohydrate sulfotransferase 11 [Eurytemora carolleeae]|eukprot:XP_023320429.1 carbohydrate sulfotransferase 11-like [Eurytemora affinis]
MSDSPPSTLQPLPEIPCERSAISYIKRSLSTFNLKHIICTLVAVIYLGVLLHEHSPSFSPISRHPRKFTKSQKSAKGRGKFKPETQEDALLLAEFGRRKKRVRETCEHFGAYTTKEKLLAKLKLEPDPGYVPGIENDLKTWNLLKKSSFHQFFLEKTHELLWCKVPKAASTSWLYAFLKMANVLEDEIPEDNGMGLHALLREKYPLLAKNLFKKYIPSALKFLVVRHPFERLMSAYMDKLNNYNRDVKYRGGYYHAMYGGEIVDKYREKYSQRFPHHPMFKRKEPSFVEFVHFLIENPVEKFDEHWKPIFLLCPPCHFNFDIIVKMETFSRDTDFLLKMKNLEGNVSLKRKHSTLSKVEKAEEEEREGGKDIGIQNTTKFLFSQLSKRMVRALHDKYRVDFEMFEYTTDNYIRFATDSDELMPNRLGDLENMQEEEGVEENTPEQEI